MVLEDSVPVELSDLLEHMVNKIEGALAAAIGSTDGLIIEQYPIKGQNLAALVAEEASLLLNAQKAYKRGLPKLANYQVLELMFSTEKLTCYAQMIDDELFCLVLLRFGHQPKSLREFVKRYRGEFLKALA